MSFSFRKCIGVDVSPRTFGDILDWSQILPSEWDDKSDKVSEENCCCGKSGLHKTFSSCFSTNSDYLRSGNADQTICKPFS